MGNPESFVGWVTFQQGRDVCEVRTGEILAERFSERRIRRKFVYFALVY